MAFIQEHHRVFGHVVGQGAGRLAWLGARQVPGVVFNTFTVAHFSQHFQVKPGSLFQALRLYQFPHSNQFAQALGQL